MFIIFCSQARSLSNPFPTLSFTYQGSNSQMEILCFATGHKLGEKKKKSFGSIGKNQIKVNTEHLWLGKQPVFKKSCFTQRCLSAVWIVSLGEGAWAGEGDLFSDSRGMGPHADLWFICGRWRETVSCVVTHLCYRQ